MKSTLQRICACLLGFGLVASARAADVQYTPNIQSGTLTLTTASPTILSLLEAPGDLGLVSVEALAYGVGPISDRYSVSDLQAAPSRLSSPYSITIDSTAAGVQYSIAPIAFLMTNNQAYYFQPKTSDVIVTGTLPNPLDFSECVGLVDMLFTDANGVPQAVQGGDVLVYDTTDGALVATLAAMAPGTQTHPIVLPSGRSLRLDIHVWQGTTRYTDRREFRQSIEVKLACDENATVSVAVPDAGALGSIRGRVDIQGEWEAVVDGRDDLDYPDYTGVTASYGPFSNQRWFAVPGSNFTVPSSGNYLLPNVVPTTLDPASTGYTVSAQMVLRNGHRVATLRTPALGWGSNPGVKVDPGQDVDLGGLFDINPGFIRGGIRLEGPSETPSRPSMLRGLLRASDPTGDVDGDGLPDFLGTYGIYWSSIGAEGVDAPAPGATRTASFGLAYSDFEGDFKPATASFEGDYEVVVGGLASEPSLWAQRYVNLTFTSPSGAVGSDYFYTSFGMTRYDVKPLEIQAGQKRQEDIALGFGEVCVRFRSPESTFFNPRIIGSYGGMTNVDFRGVDASYQVYVNQATGWPYTAADAASSAEVRLVLPQGSYVLNPAVTPATGTYGFAGLQPVEVKVGFRERVCVEPCLALQLTSSTCTTGPSLEVTGRVASCDNPVALIRYRLDGGSWVQVCKNCGPNPVFSFTLTLPDECTLHRLEVEAMDGNGGLSSVETDVRRDSTPPVIVCPKDIVVDCTSGDGVVVDYTVEATDNCAGPVKIVCDPPSGTRFLPGVHEVRCTAVDACGNVSAPCTFKVTVGSSALSIEKAVIVKWACDGVLQGADEVDGPWTDIPGATSPYSVASSQARKFYRIRP